MLPDNLPSRGSLERFLPPFPALVSILVPPIIWAVALMGSLKGWEPFATWFYCLIWWPTLLFLDGLLLWKEGESWLWAHRRELLRIFCWSMTIWLVFEALNLRLLNWRYVGLPRHFWVRWPGYALSFATVLPAILMAARLLAVLGLGRRNIIEQTSGYCCSEKFKVQSSKFKVDGLVKSPNCLSLAPSPPGFLGGEGWGEGGVMTSYDIIKVNGLGIGVPPVEAVSGCPVGHGGHGGPPHCPEPAWTWEPAALVVGTAFLVWPLAWPRYAFPLVWGAFFFLLDPFVKLLGGRSLIQGFLDGERREHLCLLAAGLLCGLWWEMWNYPAASRWVYILPILNAGKVFEMPFLGFVGFMPFALECAVMYNFLKALEERVLNTPRRRRWAVVFHLAFWAIMFAAIDARTVISFK